MEVANSFTALLSLSLPAILNQASLPIAKALEIAIIGHAPPAQGLQDNSTFFGDSSLTEVAGYYSSSSLSAEFSSSSSLFGDVPASLHPSNSSFAPSPPPMNLSATSTLAAYSASDASVTLATQLSNFLVTILMAQVGQAVGAGKWADVGRRVRWALLAALGLGLLSGLALALLRKRLNLLFRLSPALAHAARPYFLLRAVAAPFLMLQGACCGVLGGYQRLRAVALVNTCTSLLLLGADLALLWGLKLGLYGAGLAALLSAMTGAALALLLVARYPPETAGDQIRLLPSFHAQTTPTISSPSVASPDAAAAAAATATSLSPVAGMPSYSPPASPHAAGDEPAQAFSVAQFLKDSGNVMARSMLLQGSLYTMAICASRLGAQVLAAHQITTQLWMLTSYIVDGFADVGTMIGSFYLGQRQFRHMISLCRKLLFLGVTTGGVCCLLLWLFQDYVMAFFTYDQEVLVLLSEVWPLVSLMLIINSAVFVYDGILYATQSYTFMRNVLLSGVVFGFAPMLYLGFSAWQSLFGLWLAKAVLNIWRCVSAFYLVNVIYWRKWLKSDNEYIRLIRRPPSPPDF